MLRFMRKYATGYLVKGIFGLIIVVFVFWGVGGMQDSDKVVAEVGKHKVTAMEYGKAYDRMYQLYRSIYKEKFDEGMIKTLRLREAALYDLVDRYLLIDKGREMGITVTEQEFLDSLKDMEAFKKGGKFDRKRYVDVLKASGIGPDEYEEARKMDVLVSKVIALIRDNGAVMNETRVYEAFVRQKGKIDLAYMAFNPSDYGKEVKVSDKEVEGLYEKEKGSHVGENEYRLKYITLSGGGALKDDTAYMDLLKVKNIDAYAKSKGLTVTDLGTMKESEIMERLKNMNPGSWLKGLGKGDISLPVRLDTRSYIFQLVDFEAGKPIDKATVLKEIRARVIRQKATGIAWANAEEAIRKKEMTSGKETGFIDRTLGTLPGIGEIPNQNTGIMALSKDGEFYSKPAEIGGKFYVFSLKASKVPAREEWEKEKGPFTQYVRRKSEDEFYKSFMAELRKKSGVKYNWNEIGVNRSE